MLVRCPTVLQADVSLPLNVRSEIEVKRDVDLIATINVYPADQLVDNHLLRFKVGIVVQVSMYPLGKTGYFLSGSSSRLIEPRCVQRRFHKILMACGLENRNFHVLRHTFATRCVEARIDIKTLSEILGHSSVTITMNRYVHPSLELKRETMEQLADFISVK